MKLKSMLKIKWNERWSHSLSRIEREHILVQLHFVIFILQKRNHRFDHQNKIISPLFYFEALRELFMTLEVELASRRLFPCTLCLYTSVFMWRGDGASAAGASWFCPALPCTLWGSVLDQGPGPSLRHAAPLQPLQSADSHWHYISWGDTAGCVCVCWSVAAPFSLLLWSKTKCSADPSFLLVLKPWGVIRKAETGRRGQKAASHGCAHHTWNGGPGGIGQPARLEHGTSDLEEVVQSWADAMQTLPRSLVQDWKMLPGMTAPRALAAEISLKRKKSLNIAACFVQHLWMITVPEPDVFVWVFVSYDLPSTFPPSEASQ